METIELIDKYFILCSKEGVNKFKKIDEQLITSNPQKVPL